MFFLLSLPVIWKGTDCEVLMRLQLLTVSTIVIGLLICELLEWEVFSRLSLYLSILLAVVCCVLLFPPDPQKSVIFST